MTIEIFTPIKMIEPIETRLAQMRVSEKYQPFAAPLLKFMNDFSRRLQKDKEARTFPELQALGFWLREAALKKLKKSFSVTPGAIAVPQGVVFHIPPANVDTLFAYSLFTSMLCGNANIVRLPTHKPRAMLILLRMLNESRDKDVAKHILILGYPHNDLITEMLSRSADLRVIWGGDKTASALRAIPAAPFTREMIFPDRFSWSLIKVSALKSATAKEQNTIIHQYVNDVYGFDQNACSSPRILLWLGKKDKKLIEYFYQKVADVAAKNNERLNEGGNILNQTKQYAAMADMSIAAKRTFGSLTVFTLSDLNNLSALRDNPCFGGTLFEYSIDKLPEIIPHIERRDQTLVHFGLTTKAIDDFAKRLNGRGLDRMARIGNALTFDTVWDGYDLPRQFTRLMKIG